MSPLRRIMAGTMRQEMLPRQAGPAKVQALPQEQLRACVRWLDYSRMGSTIESIANTPAKLVAVWAACCAGEWDIYADNLAPRQIREAIKGIVPKFTEGPNGLVPVYEKGKR